MTAVISREQAARTGLTAAAGMLMLAVAFVMMVVAAPGHGHVRVHPAKPSVVLLTTDLSHAPAFTGRTTSAGHAAPGPNAARP
jgi:hypothetical protein